MTSSQSTPRVILSYHTIADADFETRLRVAAEAGFSEVGLDVAAYRDLRAQGTTPTRMRELLGHYGVTVGEIETIVGFDAGYSDRDEPGPAWGPPELGLGLRFVDRDIENEFYEMAKTFGAHHVTTVGSWGDIPLVEQASERFGALCDRAAKWDLAISLEYVPMSNIPDAATAATIVGEAGRPNGGVVADIFHERRGANNAVALGGYRAITSTPSISPTDLIAPLAASTSMTRFIAARCRGTVSGMWRLSCGTYGRRASRPRSRSRSCRSAGAKSRTTRWPRQPGERSERCWLMQAVLWCRAPRPDTPLGRHRKPSSELLV